MNLQSQHGGVEAGSARPDCRTAKPCHRERKREEEQKKRRGDEAEGWQEGTEGRKGNTFIRTGRWVIVLSLVNFSGRLGREDWGWGWCSANLCSFCWASLLMLLLCSNGLKRQIHSRIHSPQLSSLPLPSPEQAESPGGESISVPWHFTNVMCRATPGLFCLPYWLLYLSSVTSHLPATGDSACLWALSSFLASSWSVSHTPPEIRPKKMEKVLCTVLVDRINLIYIYVLKALNSHSHFYL